MISLELEIVYEIEGNLLDIFLIIVGNLGSIDAIPALIKVSWSNQLVLKWADRCQLLPFHR